MPIYEYECVSCHATHEVIQKFSDAPLVVCPACGCEVRKLVSSTSFVLKGSGWYKDGYSSTAKGNAVGTDSPATAPVAKDTAAPSAPASDSPAKKDDTKAA